MNTPNKNMRNTDEKKNGPKHFWANGAHEWTGRSDGWALCIHQKWIEQQKSSQNTSKQTNRQTNSKGQRGRDGMDALNIWMFLYLQCVFPFASFHFVSLYLLRPFVDLQNEMNAINTVQKMKWMYRMGAMFVSSARELCYQRLYFWKCILPLQMHSHKNVCAHTNNCNVLFETEKVCSLSWNRTHSFAAECAETR